MKNWLEKIQHHLGQLFLLALILTQSLIFVASKAVENTAAFPEVMINPTNNATINQGVSIYFEAQSSILATGDTVYFSLRNAAGNEINFEASRQTNGNWKANSAWDTASASAGIYQLKLVASSGTSGMITSTPISFTLRSSTPTTPTLDSTSFNTEFTYPRNNQSLFLNNALQSVLTYYPHSENSFQIIRVYFNLYTIEQGGLVQLIRENISTNSEVNISGDTNYQAMIELAGLAGGAYRLKAIGQVSDGHGVTANVDLDSVDFFISDALERSPLAASFTNPQNGQALSTSTVVSVALSRALENGHSLRAFLLNPDQQNNAISNRLPTNFTADIALGAAANNPNSLSYSATANFSTYAPGLYSLRLYDKNVSSSDASLLSTINISILAPVPVSPIISLVSPADNTAISTNTQLFSLETNMEASTLALELFKIDDPALSTGDVSIERVDGKHWSKTLELSNELLDGDYKLEVRARFGSGSSSQEITKNFYFTLARNNSGPDLSTASVRVDKISDASGVDMSDTITTGIANLSAVANIGSGKVVFVLKNNIDPKIIRKLNSSGVSQISENNATAYKYWTALDSNDLPNGSYTLTAELYYHDILAARSAEKIISIYYPDADLQNVTLDGSDIALRVLGVYRLEPADNTVILYLLSNLRPSPTPLRLSIFESSGTNLGFINFNAQSEQDRQKFLSQIGQQELNISTWQLYRAQSNTLPLPKTAKKTLYLSYVADNTPRVNSNTFELSTSDDKVLANVDILRQDTSSSANDLPQDTARVTEVPGITNDQVTSSNNCNLKNETNCATLQALTTRLVDRRCQEQNIYDATTCEDYLKRLSVDLECQNASIFEGEKCKDYLLEKYGRNVECHFADQATCQNVLRNQHLNRLVVSQKDKELLAQTTNVLYGQNISVRDLKNQLVAKGLDAQVLPLKDDQGQVSVIKAKGPVVLESIERLSVFSDAVLIIDSDGDKLPDDLEAYYGTDKNKKDSDGDGFDDGTEINNGYNPNGEGKLEKERSQFDRAVLADQPLEQPLVENMASIKDLYLQSADNTDRGIALSGVATPNSWVNVYIYSDLPLVLVAKTDASGNWQYTIDKSLVDGSHRAFVTINDDTGKIVKQSAPFSFLIKEAKAVTPDQYFDEANVSNPSDNFLKYYILAGGLVVLLALVIVYLMHRRRGQLEV